MRTHTNDFKDNIKKIGRILNSKITYTIDNQTTTLGMLLLNSITPHFESSIMRSTMKQLDIDSNVEIPVGTEVNYQLGLRKVNYTQTTDVTYQDNKNYFSLVNSFYVLLFKGRDYNVGDVITGTIYNASEEYEYMDYGNYIVYSVEKQEDTHSYKIICYDKMLYSMKDYETPVIGSSVITYPITVKNYISAICSHLGLVFANENDTFPNYDKEIKQELYLAQDGTSLDYTFRDVLTELAQVTASTICINENDQLELRYINNTNDTIDEEFLKDINVNFGQKFGPVNSIVLSRAGESDNVFLQDEESVEENGLCEIKIVDNQIMNDNDRSDFLTDILEELDGLEYYINDFSSTGILYYELCDKYTVSIGENNYSCIMFNDEVNVTQGLEELVNTPLPEETETEYQYANKTDKAINKAYIIVKKNQAEIEAVVSTVQTVAQTENNNYQELLNKFQSIDENIADISEIENIVRQLQTDTYTKTEIQQIANGTGVDGVKVSAVISTSGTFDENGMTYEKTGAKTKTTINEVGVNVKDSSNNSLLFAGHVNNSNTDYADYEGQTIVGTDNIIVKNYLNVGSHSRIQDYENGTGIFYM